MNGRLYDPKLHRFLQTDNYVQDPGNTQNYNSYGYVLNNPLKYTDPSGWLTQAEEKEKAQKAEEEIRKAGQSMLDWEAQQSDEGADGITSQQWASLGGQGVNNQLYGSFVNQNRDTFNSALDYVMKQTFPSFSTLWSNYPPDKANGSHAHPSVDPYRNQCAIRVGDAFMKSGIDMSSYPQVNKTSDGYPRSSKGLADWTWQNFGKPMIMSQDAFEKNYSNSTGLIYIVPPPGGIGHIDLFNRGTTGSGYYLGSQIWFWPIK